MDQRESPAGSIDPMGAAPVNIAEFTTSVGEAKSTEPEVVGSKILAKNSEGAKEINSKLLFNVEIVKGGKILGSVSVHLQKYVEVDVEEGIDASKMGLFSISSLTGPNESSGLRQFGLRQNKDTLLGQNEEVRLAGMKCRKWKWQSFPSSFPESTFEECQWLTPARKRKGLLRIDVMGGW